MLSVFFCFSADFGSVWNRVFHCRPKTESCQSFPLSTLHNFVSFETDAPVLHAATSLHICESACVNLTHAAEIYSNEYETCVAAFVTVIYCRRCVMCWCVTNNAQLCNVDAIWQISDRLNIMSFIRLVFMVMYSHVFLSL